MVRCNFPLAYAGLALISLFLGAANAEDVVAISGQKQFDKVIQENEFVVMEFYAPWCGHCKKLAPEYEKAAGILKANDPPVVLAKVDATAADNKEVADKYGVKGYPTLKIFRGENTEAMDYTGPRVADGIVSYLTKQAGAATKLMGTSEDLKQLVADNDVVVVGIFSSLEDAEFKAFSLAANELREDVTFGHTIDSSIFDEPVASPSIIMYKNFDDNKVTYEGDFSSASLSEWARTKSMPLVTELDSNPKNRAVLSKLFGSPIPKAIMFADYKSSGADEMKAALKEAAALHVGKILFVQADADANEGALKFFGLSGASMPAVVVHDTDADLKYLAEQVDPASLTSWLKDFAAGEVEPNWKSEEVPESNAEPVKVVVGKTFKQMVDESSTDVFIEFYAPWCGHCKKLEPIWNEVAKHYESTPSLVLAKMDATANDVSNKAYVVKGFPTLYFKQAGEGGEIIPYQGDRSKADLISFIKKHTTAKTGHEEL
mmetsp:Transcript_14501/g.31028  ORF Transcript_14501/g.31028 Transcript_14501/m.31028 type:complete len:488 (-) Transcript_14501:250-1713(-)